MARRRHNRGRRLTQQADLRDPLIRRAIRLARKGDFRRAAVVLRELVAAKPSAANWSKLGIVLLQAGRHDQALDALKQGIWLHRRTGYTGRADALRPWVDRARIGAAANFGWAA
jgi:Flp pilus assembly protein TadD